jgi:hypothetical protein
MNLKNRKNGFGTSCAYEPAVVEHRFSDAVKIGKNPGKERGKQ